MKIVVKHHEVRIYKRKQESKKTRSLPRKRLRKKRKFFFISLLPYWSRACFLSFFLTVIVFSRSLSWSRAFSFFFFFLGRCLSQERVFFLFFLFFLIAFLVESVFSYLLVFFYKFPPPYKHCGV